MVGVWRLCLLILLFLLQCGNCEYICTLDLTDAKCTMSSTESPRHCGLAINGNTSTRMTRPTEPEPHNCISTTMSDNEPYWQLDLGKTYKIRRIIVYPQLRWPRGTVSVQVLVDNVTVAQFASDEKLLQNPLYISNLTSGRVIKLIKSPYEYLTVCEVQVEAAFDQGRNTTFAIYDGFMDCSEKCSAGCQDGTCNVMNGSCEPCKTGWLGPRCEETCSQKKYGQDCLQTCSAGCYDASCDITSGRCEPCKEGWTGSRCEVPCIAGTYGWNCLQTCSLGCENGTCDVTTGECRCKTGYVGSRCQEICSREKYGQDCLQTCSAGCKDDTCDLSSGACEPCYPGWTGSRCEACETNVWGPNCSLTCGNCAGDGSCGQTSASCTVELASSESRTGAIAGYVVGAVSVSIAILVAAVLFLRSRRLQKAAQTDRQNEGRIRNDSTTETVLDVENNTSALKDTSPPDSDGDSLNKLDRYENSDALYLHVTTSLQL